MKKVVCVSLPDVPDRRLTVPASAAGPLEYSIDAPGDPDYGTPPSFEPVITADGGARKNEDVSKTPP